MQLISTNTILQIELKLLGTSLYLFILLEHCWFRLSFAKCNFVKAANQMHVILGKVQLVCCVRRLCALQELCSYYLDHQACIYNDTLYQKL